jgi:hypothetical protein
VSSAVARWLFPLLSAGNLQPAETLPGGLLTLFFAINYQAYQATSLLPKRATPKGAEGLFATREFWRNCSRARRRAKNGDMSRKMIPVEESFAEWRKAPEYVKAYDALEDEFSLTAAMIDGLMPA